MSSVLCSKKVPLKFKGKFYQLSGSGETGSYVWCKVLVNYESASSKVDGSRDENHYIDKWLYYERQDLKIQREKD